MDVNEALKFLGKLKKKIGGGGESGGRVAFFLGGGGGRVRGSGWMRTKN